VAQVTYIGYLNLPGRLNDEVQDTVWICGRDSCWSLTWLVSSWANQWKWRSATTHHVPFVTSYACIAYTAYRNPAQSTLYRWFSNTTVRLFCYQCPNKNKM